ncbi:FecR family protein [Flagellimonas myxillae]|uniref:FecR family protein n=1 Tax=Flagellimonas myxillae TaxID=2942214 RepID=UPI00201F2935|nr:FecR family protein [Muricauda myxillae]MCL6265447.1 FecR domain-containing protein [Muricauda myxillae]
MDYHDYELEDFLADPEFRDWVIKPNRSSHFFWKNWLTANPSKKEMVLAAKEILLSLSYYPDAEIDSKAREELLTSILGKNRFTSNNKNNLMSYMLPLAACGLLLFGLVVGMRTFATTALASTSQSITYIVKENLRGKKSRITLPDGSTVFLNNNSKIKYASRFVKDRQIFLEGEAYFEVEKDASKPFLVKSNGLVTKALGTAFNIKAHKGEQVEVGLVEGKISVGAVFEDQNVGIIDKPGGKATYVSEEGELSLSAYADMDFYKWTERTLVFKAAGFNEIEETLENWYDVDITVHNLNRRVSYTGEFPSESLENVLKRISYVEKFTYRIDKEDERAIAIYF